jgi:hypothetical protein
MFSAFQTFGKLGALASSVARAWSPLALEDATSILLLEDGGYLLLEG